MSNEYRPAVNMELFKKFDQVGKKASSEYFKSVGYQTEDNEDRYGIDQLLFKAGKLVAYVECAVKGSWGFDFAPEYFEIPFKKIEVYGKLTKEISVYFTICNKYGSTIFIMDFEKLYNVGSKQLLNRGRGDNEPFWVVPTRFFDSHETNMCLTQGGKCVQLQMEIV